MITLITLSPASSSALIVLIILTIILAYQLGKLNGGLDSFDKCINAQNRDIRIGKILKKD